MMVKFISRRERSQRLGYSDPSGAIQKQVTSKYKFECGKIQGGQFGHLQQGGQFGHLHPHTLLLTEPGLYEIIFSSHLPAGVTFRDRIFSEVLPSIRRTGSYTMNDPIEKLQSITLDDLLAYGGDQRKEYKTIVKTHANMLKDPVAVEKDKLVD